VYNKKIDNKKRKNMLLLSVIATVFNFIIILIKLKKGRKLDALIDGFIFFFIVSIFKGSQDLVQIGMISSACISVYLWFFKFNKNDLMNLIKIN
jgi:hypothetical protein